MGRRARQRDSSAPAAGAEFLCDDSGGVTVVIDGFPQSYVHPADPGLLPFEYVQHIAAVIDVLPIGKIAVTHVGGAGLALARYVEYTRPGSPQIVLEPRAGLTEQVRARLPLPRGHRIRVRAVPGETGITELADGSADLVIIDAFAQGRVPPELTTVAFWRHCARVTGTDGTVVANIADAPGLAYAGRIVATARAAGLPRALFLGTHDVLRGKRFGNVVVVAAAHQLPEDDLRRRLARSPLPAGLRGEADSARLTATALPIRDEADGTGPEPPPPDRWRAI